MTPTILVTGATGGIGKATAAALAAGGARVIIVGRDPERGQAAVTDIQHKTGSEAVTFMRTDLASLEQVSALARKVAAEYGQLDVLVNNMGRVFKARQESPEGLEMSLALNHLGPFLLTHALLPLLRQQAPSRIIFVTSNTHRMIQPDLDDLRGRRRWRGFHAYGQAKLLSLLCAYELSRRLEGTGVVVNVADPGGADTEGSRTGSRLMALGLQLMGLTPERAARAAVYLASAPEAAGMNGVYLTPHLTQGRSSRLSYDQNLARRAYELSLELVGLDNVSANASSQKLQPGRVSRTG